MAAQELTNVLAAAQSPDASIRQQAEAHLESLKTQQPAVYMLSLASELHDNAKPVDTRRLAGLLLKNVLDAKDEKKKAALSSQWLALDPTIKQQIKTSLLSTLAAEANEIRHTSAMCVAKVAAIEIPEKQWPELIQSLLANMSVQPPNPGLRQSTLEALGYVCEELGNFDDDFLDQDQVNAILTAVVQGMQQQETNMDVRLAATNAFNNALEFAHTNFSNDTERNYIMQMVCEGTLSGDSRVRQAAWECLVRIAEGYYERLPAYMSDLFALSQRTVREDEDIVALQALEFWCTVAEEEQGLLEDEEEGAAQCHNFVRAALPQLVPLLLEQLTKQEEGQENEDGAWNVAMAGGTCLALCSAVVKDSIVELVMPYVQENIQKNEGAEDWRRREAATFAFGSILEGPSVQTLAQLCNTGLGFLLAALKDHNPQVKNTTAWTIGRIFEFVHGEDVPILNPQNLPSVVTALLESINDAPHIAEKVCYAISQLASGFRSSSSSTSPLSPYFKDLVGALLATATRQGVDPSEQVRLQTQAFEGMNEVVRSAALDAAPLVAQLLPVATAELDKTLHMSTGTAESAERQAELQGLLCGVVQVAVSKLMDSGEAGKQAAVQAADAIMASLLRVFACRPNSVHEEAMLAVGSLTYACGRSFAKYMEQLFPVLERGLQQHQEWQVCQVTVGVLCDISRAIEEQLFPYCDRIMMALLTNLQSDEVHRNIKPQILSSFGDIALAIGDRFEKYLAHVVQMLQSAMGLSLQQQQQQMGAAAAGQSVDEDAVDYNNLLRQGVLESWAGMLNGLSREKADQYLLQYAPGLLEFIEAIASDVAGRDRGVWKSAAALLGDIASSLSGVGALFAQKPFVQNFLQQCSSDPSLSDIAHWSAQMVGKATSSGQN